MGITQKDERLVAVDLVADGVIHGGLSRKKGERVQVTESMAADWREKGWIRAAPRVRCNQADRLIGRTVCQPGDVVEAPSIAMATELHQRGVADWLNADECGEKLPKRADQMPIPNGHRRVRMLKDMWRTQDSGPFARTTKIEKGSLVAFEEREAIQTIREGYAEPVDWQAPAPPDKVKFMALEACEVDNRLYNRGEFGESRSFSRLLDLSRAGKLTMCGDEFKQKRPDVAT